VTALLAAEAVSKRFDATVALDGVSFALAAGEVHGLVGENGAGKSTLIRLFGGVHRPDGGRLLLEGREAHFGSPADAYRAGIAIIQQELRVVPALSVAENVMLGHLPVRGIPARVDGTEMRRRAAAALERLKVSCDLDAPVGRLAFAERQAVAIARALSREARVLILDEPTAALEEREVESLFEVIGRLKRQGVAILYVSHRLEEVERIADRCSVMRDGRVVAELARGAYAIVDVVRHMVGHDVEDPPGARAAVSDEVLLESHEVRLERGGITGVAGLLGSGTSRLLRTLFGVDGGARYAVRGAPLEARHPSAAIGAGIGMVPNERAAALVAGHSVRDNIVLPSLRRFGSGAFGRMDDAAAESVVRELVAALDIRPADPGVPVRSLSGGNQQKVILARWLAARIDVLLMDEPTQGIDVAAKAHIHRLMREFAGRGGAVLFASSEIRELMALADRVLAMKRDTIAARLERGVNLGERAVREAISG
jgi:ABC-type sugar transport system ATPase subunit